MGYGAEDPGKWALLIGINRYPHVRPLTGCVNDVQVMGQVLRESFGFPEHHIILLADEQAKRADILAAMKGLTARVTDGDIVVFHYSGHGSQMTDREGDEADGLDETIVPFDSGRGAHPNLDITDDEIYLWLRELTAKTTAITLIFDCCHSGTIVRDSFGGEMRWVEADLRPVSDLSPSPIPPEAWSLLDGGRDLGPSGWLPLGERYVLIAGCSSEERSYEIQEAGVRHGALTYYLAQELLKAETGATYRDVFEAVAPLVTARFPHQHPQLEGARDLVVCGVQRIEPMAFVPVCQRMGERVVLGAGGACGLSAGSQWGVYKPGTKAAGPNEERLGVVSVTSVRAVTSEATIVEEPTPGAVAAGMRAFEESRPLDTRLPVYVEAPFLHAADVQLLVDGLDRSPVLRHWEDRESAEACVYLLPRRASVSLQSPVPMLGPLMEETWAVVGEDGDLLMRARPRNEQGVAQVLLDNLQKVARYRLVVALRNETSLLKGKLGVEIHRWTGAALETPELGSDNEPVFHEGDQLALKIVNRHDQPLFVYVLDLGLTKRIHLVYPVAGAWEDLRAGGALEIGTRPGEELGLYIPEDFPFAPVCSAGPETEGLETLKIFATTHPTDFQPLFQSGFRGATRGPAASLDDLLAATFGGGGYRDMRIPSQTGTPEDWTALEYKFKLRRLPVGRVAAGGRIV